MEAQRARVRQQTSTSRPELARYALDNDPIG